MNIHILSLFPDLYTVFLQSSIIGKAIYSKKIVITLDSLMNHSIQNKRIDVPIAGHGSGMLIAPDVIERAIDKCNHKKAFKIFFSPHGKKLNQKMLYDLKEKITLHNNQVILVAGRYEGIDARAEEEYANEIISIGDYVLMGGDLPAMVFIESITRLVSGVIKEESSVKEDSFEGPLLDSPHYGGPNTWKNKTIPLILKSGNHKIIKEWRLNQSIKRTLLTNVDWLKKNFLPCALKKEIIKNIPSHYCVLMHNEVMLPDQTVGTSSVTSIDIHDIARSSKTYGINHFFIVTKLEAQQKLVSDFLSFWHHGKGSAILKNQRGEAMKNVSLSQNLENVIDSIIEKEKIKPLIIATSSRTSIPHHRFITYHDQSLIWSQNRPILFLLGTAHGLSEELMNKCDYRLLPIEGLSDFNFLSVRSAAAIIFDRWLGLNPSDIINTINP